MIVSILDEKYNEAERVNVDPVCGEFCDMCGDCLHCYGADDCPFGFHTWVVYADQADEWREAHAARLTTVD